MGAAVFEFAALRRRCNEIGIRDFTGEEFTTPCHMRTGRPVLLCQCRHADGSYDPCPPEPG